MKTEKRVKKVDYSIMSDKKCRVCGAPLKKNSEIKGHTQCYVCFKVSKGRTIVNKYEVVNGFKTGKVIGKKDLLKIQKENIKKYKKR